MNIKRLCLIAGLLGLPVAYANALDMTPVIPGMQETQNSIRSGIARSGNGTASGITINVPIELDNFPAANIRPVVLCKVMVGDGGTEIGAGASTINVHKRHYRGSVSIQINSTSSAAYLDEATHYHCRLAAQAPEPAFTFRPPEVSGAIPR